MRGPCFRNGASMYFSDGHCDFLYGMVNSGYDLKAPAPRQSVTLRGLISGGVRLQTFAAWIDMKHRREPLSQFLSMADAFERMIGSNPELCRFTKGYDPASGKIACVLTIEGGEAVEGREDILRTAHRLGARAMTLTWNTKNELASPALGKCKKGLTFLGRDIVREMARLGMAVDVSHLNDAGIDDVLEEDVKVYASHSNARALCSSPRALRDEHIKEIARRGGTVGVNFYHKQLVGAGRASISDVVRHAMHILEVGGQTCLAIGSDFDGMGEYPERLASPADLPNLARALKEAGLTEAELEAACFSNLFGFMRSLLPE